MFKPNDKCFCESGKKFKYCCGNVQKNDEKEITFQNYEIRKMEKKLTEAKKSHNYTCLYPGCEDRSISSHSIQEKRFLNKLATNGHVLQVDINIRSKVAYINAEKKGISQDASTFFGFCSDHDTKIFQKIEIEDTIFSTPEQFFLFAYRALSQTLFTSQEMYYLNVVAVREKPLLVKAPLFQKQVMEKKYIRESFQKYKDQFDQILLTSDFEKLETVKFTLHKKADVAISSCFTLPFDIFGEPLNYKEQPKKIMLTVCYEKEKTFILISWLKSEANYFRALKAQLALLNEEQIALFVNNIIPMYCENYFISSKLFDNFSPEAKEEFLTINELGLNYSLLRNLQTKHQYSFFTKLKTVQEI
ncbi:SEC-C metal-binding domain-containing protein [Paenibacillus xylanexedens]|uniref:SEC-C metal-binding domain-containing protein n=1 Tax=Paenibacillus xylanexedens TaxID=528191 RepID=UPI001C8ECD4C|nr:SEC-C domain-containing protein [Paenibacillus xylanexedens]MBY0115273.1 SEC-C domain-containing protein [Paenibacillus xylanexedens]